MDIKLSSSCNNPGYFGSDVATVVTEDSVQTTFCRFGSFRLYCFSPLLPKHPYVHLAFMDWCKFSFMAVAESLLILISPVKPQIYCQQKPFYCPKLAVVANYYLKRENYLKATVKVIDRVVVWLYSCCAGLRHLWPFGLLTLLSVQNETIGGYFRLIQTD